MKRLPLVLSAIALAVAGCAAEPIRITAAPAPVVLNEPVQPGSTVVTNVQTVPLRAGMGRIQAILPLPSAGAGATASGATNTVTNRISAKMDNGSMQYFDTQAAGLAVGDRIEITSDRALLRHP